MSDEPEGSNLDLQKLYGGRITRGKLSQITSSQDVPPSKSNKKLIKNQSRSKKNKANSRYSNSDSNYESVYVQDEVKKKVCRYNSEDQSFVASNLDDASFNLEEEEKVLRIVKLEEGYAVLLRIVSDSEKNKKLLVRTLKGVNKWINFTPQIRTVSQKSELNIENLRLSDHMVDEEIILKQFLTNPNRSFIEILNHNEIQRTIYTRCRLCNMILGSLDYIRCLNCQIFFHSSCYEKTKKEGRFHQSGNIVKFICERCQPCSICFCFRGNSEIVKCLDCKARFHINCGFEDGVSTSVNQYCPQCIKCKWCSKGLKTQKYNIVGGDILCLECEIVKNAKAYCLVCKKIWANNAEEYRKEYIQCVQKGCDMWVHKDCDPVLKDNQSLFQQYLKKSNLVYQCPKCREQTRNSIIQDTIRFLSYFDVDKSFWQVDTTNQKYLEVIQNPMDFVKLYQKNREGFYQKSTNPYRTLFNDVRQILENCLNYNLPNTWTHRKTLILQALFNILMPMLKQKLFDLEDASMIEYSEEHMGLVNFIPQMMREAAKLFLDEAFNRSQSCITIIGSPWDAIWEKQTLYFSQPTTKVQTEPRFIIESEKKINPFVYEDPDEPLVRFSFKEFSTHLLQSQITIKVQGIRQLMARSKVAAHPYIQYMLDKVKNSNKQQMQLEFQVNSSQNSALVEKEEQNSNVEDNKIEKQEGFQNELQSLFNKLLSSDITKVKYQPLLTKTYFTFIFSLACATCGVYEDRINLLMCSMCGDTHHFFCQISNCNQVPLRVVSAVQQDIQKQWLCNKCVQCTACKTRNHKQNDLVCSLCNAHYHFRCVYPQFQGFADTLDQWRCPQCFQCCMCQQKEYFEEDRLLLMQSQSDNPQNDPILTECFQCFTRCYFCGLRHMASKMQCSLCQEIIFLNPDKEIVETTTGMQAFKQSHKSDFINLRKTENHYFHHFMSQFDNQKPRGEIFSMSNLLKESYRDFYIQCIKCQKRFHERCIKQEQREFIDGKCQECAMNYSEVLFKYEKTKQQHMKVQFQERKLKSIQPYLVTFLELTQNRSSMQRRQHVSQLIQNNNYRWPALTEEQKIVILENLDQFETYITQFTSSYETLERISKELFRGKYLSDELMDKIVLYWTLRHGSLEVPDFLTYNYERDLTLEFIIVDDQPGRKLDSFLVDNKQYDQFLTFEYMQSISWYFPFDFFKNYETIWPYVSSLQCNFVDNLRQTPYYNYMENIFYDNELEILRTCPLSLKSYIPGGSGYIKQIRNQFSMRYWDYKRMYKKSFYCSDVTMESYDKPLKNIITELRSFMGDERINENFKQYVIHQKQTNIAILEMRELYQSAMKELSDKRKQEYSQGSNKLLKPQPFEQTKQAKDMVDRMIAMTAKQTSPDSLIKSPLDDMQCQICLKKGHRSVSGRLLYCDGERWVHVNCAVWSNEVKEKPQENQISSVLQVLKNSKTTQQKCCVCDLPGSSIQCLSANCKKRFHFFCAYKGQYVFLGCKRVVCNGCIQDVQAYCADQLNNSQTERTKSSLIKTLLNEISQSYIVNDFSTYRKLIVVNSQKIDRISPLDQFYARFGNSVLLDINQSQNKPLFKSLRILVNKYKDDLYHKFIEITLQGETHKVLYKEYNKNQLNSILNNAMEVEDQVRSQTKRNAQIINLLFQQGESQVLKSFQQLQQFLNDKGFFPYQLQELITYEDQIGTILLLNTPYVRQKLAERAPLEEFHHSNENIKNYYDWFYVDDIIEDLPQQQRIAQINKIAQKTLIKKQPNLQIQEKHYSLLDLKPKVKSEPSKVQIFTPKKSSVSPQPNFLKEAAPLDKFTLSGEITPADIFQAESQTEGNQNFIQESEKIKEIEKILRQEYQSIEQQKKKRISLYVGPSRIHKYGLFSKQSLIKQQDLIIEYTGEVIRNSLADEREHVYYKKGFGDCYMFRAAPDRIIDATFVGSQARYLNHSCDPNCASRIIDYNGHHKILIYAKRDILQNEELTYDYQFEVDANKVQCFCGAKNCLGRLN